MEAPNNTPASAAADLATTNGNGQAAQPHPAMTNGNGQAAQAGPAAVNGNGQPAQHVFAAPAGNGYPPSYTNGNMTGAGQAVDIPATDDHPAENFGENALRHMALAYGRLQQAHMDEAAGIVEQVAKGIFGQFAWGEMKYWAQTEGF